MEQVQQLNELLQQALAIVESMESDNSDDGLPQVKVLRRLSKSFDFMNLSIETSQSNNPRYVIKDVFTTQAGSWDQSLDRFSIEPWAKQDYYDRNKFLEMGADHHMFGAALDKNGYLIERMPIVFGWPDGMEVYRTGSSGWANMAIFGGGSFNPDNGGGPYYMELLDDESDTLKGIGLPYGEHVSTFCVWQEI